MLDDARQVREDDIDADICIIGGGAAGITIARELAERAIRVVILESGGTAIEEETEQLNANATVTGLPYPLTGSRLRYLGGTTNHWSGHCYPFIRRDFGARTGIPQTGWPITLGDVEEYMPRAAELALFRDVPPDWSPTVWEDRLDTTAWTLDQARFERRMTFVAPENPATGNRTYAAHADPLKRASNIRLIQHANVTELIGAENGRAIERVQVRTLSGNRFQVRARTFVLAAGGIENARIMLASRNPFRAGLGNGHDQVGRYFTDHVVIYQQMARNPDAPFDALMAFQDLPPNTRLVSHYLLTDDALRAEGIDDVFFRVTPVFEALTPGADAAKRVKDAAFAGHLGQVRADDVGTAISRLGESGAWAANRAMCSADPVDFTVAVRLEPRPLADSRVTLTDRRDALDMPILNLHWALADEGRYSIRRGLERFAREIGRLNLGRMRLTFDPDKPWPDFPELDIGYHHTGTTRMSADPRSGVVDANCRVHGVENMYVAGSSVFPTSGTGSPTMMLTAMALRLVDHLKAERRI